MSETLEDIYGYYGESPEISGDVGEIVTASKLRNSGFRVLRNLYLPKENKTTTQIDMVAISSIGLLCIENKNYHNCDIYGDYYSTHFAVKYFQSRNTYKLFNPLKQNHIHYCLLKQLLDAHDYDIPIYPLVIFNDNCVLHNCKNKLLIQLNDFDLWYQKMQFDKRISNDEENDVSKFLQTYTDASDEALLMHKLGLVYDYISKKQNIDYDFRYFLENKVVM